MERKVTGLSLEGDVVFLSSFRVKIEKNIILFAYSYLLDCNHCNVAAYKLMDSVVISLWKYSPLVGSSINKKKLRFFISVRF